ncbi:aldo/keto reductase [Mycolicibacterium frederiksbergense]|uniref:Aldo/keto reductase n=1 Tax=Mycolicibacterium frederiksbergense TaxID=117567 RepID=A0A6H0S9E7_9MYCO|nr:aldo/keto reductase [Mycolicibacterium frederiksbergense]QIV83780.1 aldo/keto reductase [Mycolicibacterium frederiksbergense]
MTIDRYHLLGRSGLRVSSLALGTMNFGTSGYQAAYGKTLEESRPILRQYLEAGGNFIDTADFYTEGESETILGGLLNEFGVRDSVVLTTKFTNGMFPGDPNGGGNGRKHMIRALDASLRRLQTDYVDLYLLHSWDRLTPVEEVMQTFDSLVRAGKIRYAGLSDTPAWYAAQAQTFAVANNLSPLINIQLPYSLIERTIETEHVPMGQHLGLGVTAWSPLAQGFLSGKYHAEDKGAVGGDGRLTGAGASMDLRDRDWELLKPLARVSAELGVSMAQVAINWVATRPGVAAAIVGASSAQQLAATMAALDFVIPGELHALLDAAGEPTPESVYKMFTPGYQNLIVSPGVKVGDKPAGYLPGVRNWV